MARPLGAENKDKPWKAALLRASKKPALNGDPHRLDRVADQCFVEAESGEMAAIKEIGDRLDGKSVQGHEVRGDPDSPVIFNLRLGDGIAPKVIDGGAVEVLPDALTGPLVAIATQDEDRAMPHRGQVAYNAKPERNEAIWRARQAGQTLKRISEDHGLSIERIRSICATQDKESKAL